MRVTIVVLGLKPYFRHHRQRLLATLLFAQRRVDLQRLFQNLSHFLARVQRAIRVLEDNLNFLATQFLRVGIVLQQILALVIQLATGRGFNHGQQTAQRGFPTPGLTHHR